MMRRRSFPLAAAWIAALSVVACGDSLIRETTPLAPAQLGIATSFDGAGGGAAQAYARANRLRVRFTAGGAVRFDETLAFDPSAAEVRVPVDVTLRAATETLLLEIEVLRDADALFRGARPVTLSSGLATAAEVPLQPVLDRVVCTGPTVILDAIGATQQLGGAALFITGDTISDMTLSWSSQDAAIVSVSSSGLARAVTEGQTSVSCAAGDRSDTRVIRVAAAAATIEILPSQVALPRGGTQVLAAIVRDRLGNLIVGRAVSWTSAAPAIATVNQSGTVTAVAAGTARIDAAADGAVASATVTVRNIAPVVVTGAAQVGDSTATVSGTVNPQGIAAEAWFEYGRSPQLDGASSTPVTAVPAGNAPVAVSAALAQLAPGATYFYRAVGRNEAGVTRGEIRELRVPIAISISPPAATTQRGGVVPFTAVITGAANSAVLWESSNPAVATINAQGVATALTEGTTTISATSVADPSRRATATLTVERAATVVITSVTSAASGGGVNPAAVSGVITVNTRIAALPEHGVRSVAVYVGSVEVCRQLFQQPLDTSAGDLSLACEVDTGEADAAGVPRFLNGVSSIRVAAFDGTGRQVAQSTFCATADCTVTLANRDAVRLRVEGTGVSQPDAAGNQWWQAFTVHVTPIVYTAGVSAVRIALDAVHPNGSVSRSIGPLSSPGEQAVTFTAASLAGVEGLVEVRGEVTLTSGDTYTFVAPPDQRVRIDNLAPRLTAVAAPLHETWVGAPFTLAASAVDGGVGGVVTRIDIVPAAAPTGSPVAGGAGVTSTAGVAESPTVAAYALRITTTDRLGNTATWYIGQSGSFSLSPTGLSLFGVDNTPPELSVVRGPEHNSANYEDGGWLLAVTDAGSGPHPDSLRVRLVRYSAEYPAGVCVNPATAEREIISAVLTAPACYVSISIDQPYVSAPSWSSEDGDEGYFTMTAYVVDRAGNRSPTLTRTTLFDGTWATVESVTAPAVVVGSERVSVSAQLFDNVDLAWASVSTLFSGDTAVNLVHGRVQLSTYGLPLVTSATVPFTIPQFIRSVTQTFEGSISDRIATARQIQYTALDQARAWQGVTCNMYWDPCGSNSADITGAVEAGLGEQSFRNWLLLLREDQNIRFWLESPELVNGGSQAVVRAVLTGTVGLESPFERVEFYIRRSFSAANPADRIGLGSVSMVDPGDFQRIYTYTATVSASGLPDGEYEIFALGVDANGDALMTWLEYVTIRGGSFAIPSLADPAPNRVNPPAPGASAPIRSQ